MDRIDGTGNFLFRPDVPNQETKSKKNKKSASARFKGVLGKLVSNEGGLGGIESSGVHSMEELEEIVDDIQRYGDDLIKFPGVDNLARYKQAVKDFIGHVIKNAYSAEDQISRRNILNQKKYTIVKVVDTKLEALSRSVLGSQAAQIDLLSSIEEIQGLLVDILHVQ